jgi:acyl transferase domain-containing protein
LRERCAARRVAAAQLSVSHAFHSPLVAEGDRRAARWLDDLHLGLLKRSLISTVDGQVCLQPERLRALWTRHASSPVRFTAAVRAAESEGGNVFVQLYGGDSLLTMAKRSLAEPASAEFAALSSAESDDGLTFLSGLGRLATLGVPVNLLPLFEDGSRRLLTLPPSPLATEHYSVRKADPTRRALPQPQGSQV